MNAEVLKTAEKLLDKPCYEWLKNNLEKGEIAWVEIYGTPFTFFTEYIEGINIKRYYSFYIPAVCDHGEYHLEKEMEFGHERTRWTITVRKPLVLVEVEEEKGWKDVITLDERGEETLERVRFEIVIERAYILVPPSQ